MKSTFYAIAISYLLFISYTYIEKVCGYATDKFAISKISTSYDYKIKWQQPPPDEETQKQINQLLDQKFYYLNRGGQCFAFLSEDGTTVLKFSKQYLRPPVTWCFKVPILNRWINPEQKRIAYHIYERERDYASYFIALDYLKEETGLITLHLDKTENKFPKATIVDKLNIEHRIDLDSREFILQKKADRIYPYIEKLMGNNEVEKAKETVDSIIDLIVTAESKRN